MRAKFVKDFLYESKIYDSHLNETFDYDDTFFDEDRELSSGEKIALAKGLKLITGPQLAALYLTAKKRIGKTEDKSKYFLGQMAQKMNRRADEEDYRDLPYYRLADYLDMNPLTVSRTVAKFKLLIQGLEAPVGEVLYKKVIEAYKRFLKMQDGEIAGLAEEALNFDVDTSRGDEYAEKVSIQSKISRDKKKILDKKKGFQIRNMFLQLKAKMDPYTAAKKVAATLAKEYNVDVNRIKEVARLEFKNDGFLLKYWK